MAEQENKYRIDRSAEIDGDYQVNIELESADTPQDAHTEHHHHYDPKCEQCRQAAEAEYRRKLASGELNRIDVVD